MIAWALLVGLVWFSALIGWVAGRGTGDSEAWTARSEAERLLAEEKERADDLAEAVRGWLFDGDDALSALAALGAHNAARAAEVER